MDIKPIRTDADYEAALREIEQLLDTAPHTPANDRLEVLATLVYKNAFNRFEAGYGAAQGVTISMFAGIIIVSFVYLRRRGWEI